MSCGSWKRKEWEKGAIKCGVLKLKFLRVFFIVYSLEITGWGGIIKNSGPSCLTSWPNDTYTICHAINDTKLARSNHKSTVQGFLGYQQIYSTLFWKKKRKGKKRINFEIWNSNLECERRHNIYLFIPLVWSFPPCEYYCRFRNGYCHPQKVRKGPGD